MDQSKKPVRWLDRTGIMYVILGIIVVLQVGCPGEIQQPTECVEFFKQESTNRLREFGSLDLDKQLTIHRCGLDRHPPYDRSYEIADRGKIIIPTLLEKLNKRDYKSNYDADKSKYAIILIFERLADRGELSNDNPVIAPIEEAVSEIRTEWIRKKAEELLGSIKQKYRRSL